MLFSSSIFLFIFLPVVLIGNLCLRQNRGLQNVYLLFWSLFFYAWGEPWFVLVMMASILANYGFGYGVDRYRSRRVIVHALLAGAVFVNIGLIFVFKYLNFTIREMNGWFGLDLPQTQIVLPIGISFFTFQALSYVIDVYRGHGKPQTNPLNVALYVAFFPQLIAGPIVRYETVAEQIRGRIETSADFIEGVRRFIVGLAKKILLANTLAVVADQAFNANPNELSVAMAWLGALAYTFQIFFDFSGYSDMAIGLGRMLGFHFLENFNFPYISKSVSEFWRRWHISLGTWFRDYLYIPLGGNRVSATRLFFNLFVVWLLTGLWHGANWTFITWGLYYFVFIAVEKAVRFEERWNRLAWLKHLYTLLVAVVGWVLFRSPDIHYAVQYLGVMVGLNSQPAWDSVAQFYCHENIWFFIMAIIFSMPIGVWMAKMWRFGWCANILRVLAYLVLFLLSMSYVVKSSYNPFIYFNF